MLHLNVEYFTNLEERTDVSGLSARLCEAVLSTGLFEVGAVRVREVREFESDLSCKHNAMDARLRKAAREGFSHVQA